ncbi:haloacid dehalogenase [Enterococcus florum]|uniref:Haloacid dehalogenase n=1 Tax=Enterococcus florum TaxID=2480627 RepID=A0A4P5PAD6_9ENTE|nr:HAD family phosphatase [Enterococcus florum]GCF93364.1 haloacid dehalogenase [Enterococcus florum]
MKNIKGVIFDMDGLIFDTEAIYYKVQQETADRLGIPFSKEIYLEYIGVADEEVFVDLHERYASHGKELVQQFIDESWGETHRIFKAGEVELKPGALELLQFLEENQIPRIVASSNVRPIIEVLLEHAQIRDKFQGIVSAEDVQLAKPDPEIFMIARERLGTEAEETLVLEDAHHGVMAAVGAAIPVIMVPDLIPPSEELKEKTEAVFTSLHDVIDYIQA